VGEHAPEGDGRPVRQRGQVLAERSVEAQAPHLDALADEQAGDERLGERGQIVDGVEGRGGRLRLELALPVRAEQGRLPGPLGAEHQPGHRSIGDGC